MRSTLLISAFLVACGGEPPTPAPKPVKHEAHPPAPVPGPAPEAEPKAKPTVNVVTDDGTTATVALEANDAMKFNTSRIEVTAGRKVKLTLTHTGSLAAAVMGHNFVLLKQGTDGQDFALKSATAKDAGYIAADLADSVIAHTKVIGGGESVTIEFDAPEPGEYPFLCSFPGHYAIMNGVFVVK